MVPLSALTNLDGQQQSISQHCCIPQVSSASTHGSNIVHAPQHAPICSMGPLINRGGQLYHCVGDINATGANTLEGMFAAQHQPSHPSQSSNVMLNLVQYPQGTKSSIVSESSADTNHPQGPLPPTPVDRGDSSIAGEQTSYLMELPSRPASAGAAAIQAASSLGLETGYQNHIGQRQHQQQHPHFSTFFQQQMDPLNLQNQGVPMASSISCLPAGSSGSNNAVKRESSGSSRRNTQLRKQQSISCAYEYCDDKTVPTRHQPNLQSINDLDG